MFLLIDTANLEEISKAMECFPLAGVTTCPTIIVKEKRPFWEILSDIRTLIGDDRLLHAQVIGRTADEMFQDAVALRERVSGNFFVKVPVSLEGFKTMARLQREGIAFTATTIHSVSQAMLAADLGASFLAPYINHIEDDNRSGRDFITELKTFLNNQHLSSKILAASFRNTHQITEVLEAGAEHVTIAPELLGGLYKHPQTDASVNKFRTAWNECYGEDKNLSNL